MRVIGEAWQILPQSQRFQDQPAAVSQCIIAVVGGVRRSTPIHDRQPQAPVGQGTGECQTDGPGAGDNDIVAGYLVH